MHKNIGVKLCNMLKRKNRKKTFALNIDFFTHLLPRKNSLHFMEKGVIIHKIT